MSKLSKSKVVNGKKEYNTYSSVVYDEYYVQVYQGTFHLFYDDLKNCKMRLFWFLFDRLRSNNYFYINKKVREEFTFECKMKGSEYNDRKVTDALTELKRDGKLLSDSKGYYCFNPVHVWVGTAADRKEAIEKLHSERKI
jgi:hypothetical protein